MWYDGAIQYTPSGQSTRVLNNIVESRVRVRQSLERVYNVQTGITTLRVLQERGREISGELRINFETFDEVTEMLNDTDFRLDLVWGSTQGVTGSFYNAKWANTTYPLKPVELIMFTLPFTARSGSIS